MNILYYQSSTKNNLGALPKHDGIYIMTAQDESRRSFSSACCSAELKVVESKPAWLSDGERVNSWLGHHQDRSGVQCGTLDVGASIRGGPQGKNRCAQHAVVSTTSGTLHRSSRYRCHLKSTQIEIWAHKAGIYTADNTMQIRVNKAHLHLSSISSGLIEFLAKLKFPDQCFESWLTNNLPFTTVHRNYQSWFYSAH